MTHRIYGDTTSVHASRTQRQEECTAQLRSGRFCSSPSIPGAPFPICVHHASRVYEFLKHNIHVGRHLPDTFERLVEILSPTASKPSTTRAVAATSVVYYLQVGELIKIGRTTNLKRRLNGYPPHAKILAVEPGSVSEERRRLAQFSASLTVGREWFKPTPDLLAHIESLSDAA